jgi:hypothetical protein
MNGYWKPFRGIENPLFPRPPEIGSCPDKAVYDYSRDVAVHSDLAFVARLGRDRRFTRVISHNPTYQAAGSQMFQTNLIEPEPCQFLSADLPPVSIIRPTLTNNGGAVATIHANRPTSRPRFTCSDLAHPQSRYEKQARPSDPTRCTRGLRRCYAVQLDARPRTAGKGVGHSAQRIEFPGKIP